MDADWAVSRLAVAAAGAVLHYLRDTQRSALDHLNRPSYYERSDYMVLDAATVRNLELVEPLFAGESRDSTLIHVLDKTCTGMGGRLLRQRLLQPSCDRAEIEARLDAVAGAGRKGHRAHRASENTRLDAGFGAPAGENHAGHRRPARTAGAGPIAGEVSGYRQADGSTRILRLRHGIRSASRTMSRPDSAAPSRTSRRLNLADGGTIRDGFDAESG